MTDSSCPSSLQIKSKTAFADVLVKQEKIGSGCHGSVYRCLHGVDGKQYAVKKVRMHHSHLQWCLREVEALSSLKHDNIVRYYESWTDSNSSGFDSSKDSQDVSSGDIETSSGGLKSDVYLFIQMEHCQSDLVSKIKEGLISHSKALVYFSCLLEGLVHIHNSRYLHRDLTAKNIFIGSDDTIKIGDFGLAKKSPGSGPRDDMQCSHSLHSARIGIDHYLAPELLEKQPPPYTEKSDLYSLGIVFFEMLQPFSYTPMAWLETIQKAIEGEYPDGWENLFETQVLKIVLAKLPEDRWAPEDVLRLIQSHLNGEDSLIPANPKKRQRAEDVHSDVFENREEHNSLCSQVVALEEDVRKLRQEALANQHLRNQLNKGQKILSDLLISFSKSERQEARMKLSQDCRRLGDVGVIRAGTVVSEIWEDGKAIKDLNALHKQLLETKETVIRQREFLKKRQLDKGTASDAEAQLQDEDYLIQDEIYKSRLASIKREVGSLARERMRYEIEKGRLKRERKRIRDEDGSRFNNFQIFDERYALLNLLGKGGFSEVYKAFDLVEQRYVACKLHSLNVQWHEEKKQSYLLHANREYDIHKTLLHHHIVRLWGIFHISDNTFCTVMEYCSGKDLDAILKVNPILPEDEARIIIVQIFQGLVYLNTRPQKIIHYDLKPANVLIDELGVAKVTDFGLSKIMEVGVGSEGIELTSQGAGTYWYLPPECFEQNDTPPYISSKVDVWSAGVLMYQMLFGKRPFGDEKTQEQILREGTIISAHIVEFPPTPTVSSNVKEFIRRCLTYNQAERPDVLTMGLDPYLRYTNS